MMTGNRDVFGRISEKDLLHFVVLVIISQMSTKSAQQALGKELT